MIPRDQIDKLLASIDIIDVIGERINLKRAGANHKARCPFHDEKTPSFMVSGSKQIFKCFGCGVSGDPVKFVMMYDDLSYPDALRHLASRYGIELKEEYGSVKKEDDADDKKELYRILYQKAQEIYSKNLQDEFGKEGSVPAKYLRNRNMGEKICMEFGIGYAPESWDFLKSNTEFKKYDEEILAGAGLLKKNEKGNIYDQFRNRIVFPVNDRLGNCVAFSARTLDDEIQPKYLNSPDSLIYNKSRILYGFDKALNTIRKTKHMILVEGNIDLISMHDHGFTETVAICGTAFTKEHALLIKRNSDSITLLLDGDEAGRRSSVKTAEILLAEDVIARIAVLPEGSDPDTYLQDYGREELLRILDNAKDIVSFGIFLNKDSSDGTAGRVNSVKNIISTLSHIKDPLILSEFIKTASEELNVEPGVIRKELSRLNRRSRDRVTTDEGINDDESISLSEPAEFNIIFLMLSDQEIMNRALKDLSEDQLRNEYASKLFLKIYELFEEGEPVKLNNILFDFHEKFKDFFIGYTVEQERTFFGEDEKGEDNDREKLDQAYIESLNSIRRREIGSKIKDLNSELKYTQDDERLNEILTKISGLKKEKIAINQK